MILYKQAINRQINKQTKTKAQMPAGMQADSGKGANKNQLKERVVIMQNYSGEEGLQYHLQRIRKRDVGAIRN